jgi:hypothetical protein
MPMRNLPPTGIGMAVLGGLIAIGGVLAEGSGTSVLLIGGLALIGGGAFMVWIGRGWVEPPEDDEAGAPNSDRARR